ncbi:oxalurate catabolism protein HpxZ [Acuticoccus kandeliae]|uniref:oxalurate catabolism protein HpxZ n=1 Tax=Acuticoccus kandeliae TaxID=2073160 RepID=UPI000D3EB300|nr:oxalurate catabolism protein HpxZ [Acuticoccus kandeliae]
MSALDDIDRETTRAAVEAAFYAYEAALVANDLPAIDALFFDSPRTIRYGEKENLYGARAIAAFRAARPSAPRPRTLLKVEISTYGPDCGIANCEYRNEGEARLGRQSQTWVRGPEGWRIVSAHVSYMNPPQE